MTDRPVLFLIDGHALAYRTYFALTGAGGGDRWITKSGEPTAGTYGFTSVLLRLLEQEAPQYLAVSFDTGRTFRDDLYEDYKATREKMPDDLRLQIDRIREVCQAFGIPLLEAEGYEADDVLGTVAHLASEKGAHVVILTGDKDLLQLADDHVTIRLAGQKLSEAIDYGPQEVTERMGLPPSKIVDFKAVVGDSSDNIPGVSGVGEKTAVKLLNKYGDLDMIYEHLEDVPTRFRNKLEEQRDQAYLSRQLAAIHTAVPIAFDLEACRAQSYDRDSVLEIFRELEFRTLMDRLPGADGSNGGQLALFTSASSDSAAGDLETVIVQNHDQLEDLANELSGAESIAFDVETTGTDPMACKLVGIALAVSPDTGYYIPVGHTRDDQGGQLDLETVLDALREPLTDPAIPKVGHNLKYDFTVLARYGLRVRPLAFDTMLAEWLSDPASRNLGLKNLVFVRLGMEMTDISELIGTGRKQITMADVPVAEAAPYAAADAAYTLGLYRALRGEIEEKGLMGLFEELEMPLVEVLANMEMAGISIDAEYLTQFSNQLNERLEQAESQAFSEVGEEFNLNSPQQLSRVLFEVLGLEPPDRTRKTATGYYSTAAEVLEQLRHVHPVVDLVLEHREVSKLKSTYADALRDQINKQTGRVHTSYNQAGSVTGRLASSEPNLQNIPIRTELGRQIRRAFVAQPDHLLLAVDYSQIELRIVAHLSDDEAMLEAFRQDQDIHATTAAAVFGVQLTEVSSDMRRHAKAVNFGLIYGMSPYGLTRTTDLTLAEAEDFVNAYFERFPGVKGYLELTRSSVRDLGYVETILGRRRYFPQLKKGGPPVSEIARSRALREAINAPIQGSAADIIKVAMLRLPAALREQDLAAQMLLQVHDELLFDVPRNEIEPTIELVKRIMSDAHELKIPLKTDAQVGPNWYEMEAR